MKLDSDKTRKAAKPNFWKKKVPSSQEGPKSPKNGWKMRFFGFWQKSSPFIFFVFYLIMKVLLVFQRSAKTTCLGKFWFLRYGLKTSRPIRMQDSLNCNISQRSWDLNLSFCMWLDLHKATNSFSHFKWKWSGKAEHAQCLGKTWVSFISRMRLVFSIRLGIHRS